MSMTIGTLMAYIGADTTDLKRAERDVKKSTDVMDMAFSSLGKTIITAFSIGAVMSGFKSEIQKGLGAVESFNISVASMAGFITTFSQKTKEGDVAGAFQDALKYTNALIPRLEVLDAMTIASGRELTVVAETMAMNGVLLDINNKKQEESFLNIVNALKLVTQGQNADIQMRQEINALLMGQIRMTDRLPKLLQAIDPMLKDHLEIWKQEGTTIENVGKLLQGFGASTDLISRTWEAIGSTMDTIHTRILRGGMVPAYNDLLVLATGINRSLMDQDGTMTNMGVTLQGVIAGSWVTIKNTVETTYNLLRPFIPLVQMIGELTGFAAKGWGMIMAMLKPISEIVALIGEAMSSNIEALAKVLVLDFRGAKQAWADGGKAMGEALAINLRDEFLAEYTAFEDSLKIGENVKNMLPETPKLAARGTDQSDIEKEAKKRQKIEEDITKWNLEQLDLRTEGLDAFYTWSEKESDEYYFNELEKKKKNDELIQKATMDSLAQMTDGLEAFYSWSEQDQADYLKGVADRKAEEVQIWRDAMNAMQNYSESVFIDAMNGNWDDMLDGFVNMLQQMVARWAAAQAMIALFGEGFQSGKSDNIGGVFGAILGGVGKIFSGAQTGTEGAGMDAGTDFWSGDEWDTGTTGMASGGMITEPVLGVGTSTGRRYKFGESEAEKVTPVSQLGMNGQSGGGGMQAPPTINILANDPQSFFEFTKRNPQAIIGPITEALQKGDRNLRSAIRGA